MALRLILDNHYTGSHAELEGTEDDVREQLLAQFPWLLTRYGRRASVHLLASALDGSQAVTARLEGGDVMIKSEPAWKGSLSDRCLAAAAFLSGREPDMAAWRQSMVEHGEDPEVAALDACGLLDHDGQNTLADLRAVMQIGEFSKSAPAELPEVTPLTESARPTADMLNRAREADRAQPIALGGKHSAGAFVAVDPETGVRILFKPGSGPPSPAAGVAEMHVSQSKREAAFSEAAHQIFGVREVPEAFLVMAGGREAAAIHMTDPRFESSDVVKRLDEPGYRRAMLLHLRSGDLFRWAAMDWVLGNPDRHSGNVLLRGDQVALIDHGSALAGPDFAPGVDKSSFIPAYLRAFVPVGFDKLTESQKVLALPRAHNLDQPLRAWINLLDAVSLTRVLERYGIDSQPIIVRLEQLKRSAADTDVGAALATLWVSGR